MSWVVEYGKIGARGYRDEAGVSWTSHPESKKWMTFIQALRMAMESQILNRLYSMRLRNENSGDTLSVTALLDSELQLLYKEIHTCTSTH